MGCYGVGDLWIVSLLFAVCCFLCGWSGVELGVNCEGCASNGEYIVKKI